MQELFKRSSYQRGFLISGLSLERGSIKTKHLPRFQLLLARVAQHTRQETLSGPRTIYGDHWHRQQDYNSPLFSPCVHSVACYCTQMPLRCVENFLFVVLMSNEMFSWCAKTVAFLCAALYRDTRPSAPELQSVPEPDSCLLFFLCKSRDLIMWMLCAKFH